MGGWGNRACQPWSAVGKRGGEAGILVIGRVTVSVTWWGPAYILKGEGRFLGEEPVGTLAFVCQRRAQVLQGPHWGHLGRGARLQDCPRRPPTKIPAPPEARRRRFSDLPCTLLFG